MFKKTIELNKIIEITEINLRTNIEYKMKQNIRL